MPEFFMAFWFLLCMNSNYAAAAPIHGTQEAAASDETHQFSRRSISAPAWVPIVAALAGLIVLAVIVACWKKRELIISSWQSRASARLARPDDGVHVPLTADQLAGTINNAGSNNNTAAPRSRRNRRPRRTPSQQSTYSLPAYAKEPGEQELVVAQGPPEEDVSISQPLAIAVNVDGDTESSTETDSQIPLTPPQEASAQLVPLVEGDTACDSSARLRTADGNLRPVSLDTGSTSSTSSSQVDNHATNDSPDPRGEAPGYFEVVGQADDGVNRSFIDLESPNASTTLVTADNTSPPASPLLPSPRRSGFRALLDRTGVSRNHHTRPGSSGSGVSSNAHLPESPFRTHNQGASTTSLASILGLSRTKSSTSHNSSRPNLVSPSMISLNSISAPLTHTAVRTEFAAYPRQGLTPEQLRLISSREGLAKFGRPYGPDAVAFASMSAVDLATGQRPPDFEAAVGESSDGGDASTGTAREPSASTDNEAQPTQETVTRSQSDGEVSRAVDSTQSGSPGSSPAEQSTSATPANTENDAIHETGGEEVSEEAVVTVEGEGSRDKGKAEETSALENKEPLEEDNKDHRSVAYSVPSATPEASFVAERTPATSEVETVLEAKVTGIEASKTPDIALPTSLLPVPQTSATSLVNSSPPAQPLYNGALRANSLTVDRDPPQSAQPDHVPERSESRASLLSYASLASRGTFQTAAESMRSRKMAHWMSATDDEHEDDLGEFGYDTADDGNTTEGEGGSRPSTPTPSRNGKPNLGHGGELTKAAPMQPTPIAVKQDRHVSVATVTHS